MAKDPAFGLNGFGRPKMYSDSETLANGIMNALLSKPGSYPSIPNMGMNVAQMVFVPFEEIDTDAIKSDLVVQCRQFAQVVQDGEFEVRKIQVKDNLDKNVPMLLFLVPTVVRNVSKRLIIGIRKNGIGISFNFDWLD